MAKMQCQSCRFWFRPTPDGRLGECRRRAPSTPVGPIEGTSSKIRLFVSTSLDDWCGDFEPVASGE